MDSEITPQPSDRVDIVPPLSDEKVGGAGARVTVEDNDDDGFRHTTMATVMGDVEFVMDKVATLTVEEARNILSKLLKDHEYDYNFSSALRLKISDLLEGPDDPDGKDGDQWELELKTQAALNKFYSPYPEVRSVTTPTDDVDLPCETIRAHLLGYTWAVFGQFVNSLFYARFPSIFVGSSVMQLLLYPCGLLLARFLPDWGFTYNGKRVSLNPGPWTYKEQMLATIIVNLGIFQAFGIQNIQTQVVFFQDSWVTPGYSILLILSTSLLGLGMSGFLRRFVIYPQGALFPTALPTVALNRALLLPENKEKVHGWSITRYRFFFTVFGCAFVWFWFPDFIFNALSSFSWMTWISPSNYNLNMITGSNSGLGFNPISTFDWNVIGAVLNPLSNPWFVTVQTFFGTLLGGFIIIIIYWTNTSWTAYLPPNSSDIFDNTGNPYNITQVVDPVSGRLIEDKFKAYSPVFSSAGSLVATAALYLYYPFTVIFVFLESWRPIMKAYRSAVSASFSAVRRAVLGVKDAIMSLVRGDVRGAATHLANMFDQETSVYDGFDDVFTNLMRAYPEVPDSWFVVIDIIAFALAIVVITVWPETSTPVWVLFYAVGINFICLIPFNYLFAVSGLFIDLGTLTQVIIGYALPNRPEAMIMAKSFGSNIGSQANLYINDQKTAMYAKVPPQAVFRGQIISTIITSFVAFGAVQFTDTDISGICTPDQSAGFTCAGGAQPFYASAVQWGGIGPRRIFSEMYPALQYSFLIGGVLAPTWWAIKYHGHHVRSLSAVSLPSSIFAVIDRIVFTPIAYLRDVHPVMFLAGLQNWAPLNMSHITAALYVGFSFNYYLKRYKTAWWERYNYVLSAALDGGTAFSGIIIFFAVQWVTQSVNWWGNVGAFNTIDGEGIGNPARITDLPGNGTFGPQTWT